jgi:hypothetical protein
MLKITIPSIEQYDEVKGEFLTSREHVLNLEHSLVSISKWESKWGKPFLSKEEKTTPETIDYIRCMTISQNVNDDTYNFISNDNITQVREYIDAKMTATTFSNQKQTNNRETITAEIIYYWMIALNIPFECQKWHLNRLLALITVCNLKNTPAKKMSKREIANRNSALNATRRQALNSGG